MSLEIFNLIRNKLQIEFIRALVQLGVEKLCEDIEEISDDDSLFSHLLDEVLSFEQELDTILGVKRPHDLPSCVTVITQPQYLSKWLLIEENCKYIVLLESKIRFNFSITLQLLLKKWIQFYNKEHHLNA